MNTSPPITQLSTDPPAIPLDHSLSYEPIKPRPTKSQIEANAREAYKAALSAVSVAQGRVATAQEELHLAEETERELRPMIRLIDAELIPAKFRRPKTAKGS